MNIFLLTDAGVKRALQHEALQGLPCIGRGKFSAVFDKGDTVLRMTVDPITYEMHASFVAPQGPHFCRLVRDYGDIGEMTEWNGGHTIYLFETEKLEPLKGHLPARREAKSVMKAVHEVHGESLRGFRQSASNFDSAVSEKKMHLMQSKAGHYGFSDSIVDALDALSTFVSNYETASCDMHSGNFMVRPGCGTLIFNDPFCDASKLEERHERLSRMAG